jgi:hypothetical protein
VHCALGVKSFTTGLKSSTSSSLCIASRCARPLARSLYSDPSLVLALRASLKAVQNGACRFSQ